MLSRSRDHLDIRYWAWPTGWRVEKVLMDILDNSLDQRILIYDVSMQISSIRLPFSWTDTVQ